MNTLVKRNIKSQWHRSHIIVMQHVTKARLKEFIDDLEAEINRNK